MKAPIIFLEPVFKEVLWGGERLKEFDYSIPSSTTGECWAISAHPAGDCKVFSIEKDDCYKGYTLSTLFAKRRELFGNVQTREFPILIKIIDAKKDLSIQVHPDDSYALANENKPFGKTECWYILDAVPNAKIIIGHNAKDKKELSDMILNGRWNDFIREIPVKKGDFFFIPPGTVHAIKGGTLILETQQSSDITYRVYDYDRTQEGKKRPLHIKQSLDVINCPFIQTEPPKNESKTVNKNLIQLCSSSYFSVWKANVKENLTIEQDQNFLNVSVIEGQGKVDGIQIQKGSNFIIPFEYGKVCFTGDLELIISSI
ncbi:type I phosphomannose isomerase catalytic subunit [Treponema pectinovorum]|uniref:type I phosphomannose isomerase catalytic subunit n=1 Tax=Treponema pectinovorum TaxID=164 RepID=UPI0011C7550F|nr:type I phosphomannose isomerase catalytic subunit [Treponema pectinovorum]